MSVTNASAAPANGEPGFECDAFISYSSEDEEWVRGELIKRLDETGSKVFIEFRDFQPGAPSSSVLEEGEEEATLAPLENNDGKAHCPPVV